MDDTKKNETAAPAAKGLVVSPAFAESGQDSDNLENYRDLQKREKERVVPYSLKTGWAIMEHSTIIWDYLTEAYKTKHPGKKPDFTERDLLALFSGLGVLLSAQSVLFENTDNYTGTKKEGKVTILSQTENGEALKDPIMDYCGNIWTTKSGLCITCLGEKNNTSRNRKALFGLASALDEIKVPVPIYKVGERFPKLKLLSISDYPLRNGQTAYQIVLNPIFREGILNDNYRLMPKDGTERYSKAVKRDTPMKQMLRAFLERQWKSAKKLKQEKRKHNMVTRGFFTLIKELGLVKESTNEKGEKESGGRWKTNRGKVEAELLEACEEFVEMGLLLSYIAIRTKSGKHIEKIVFFVNPEYNKEDYSLPAVREGEMK